MTLHEVGSSGRVRGTLLGRYDVPYLGSSGEVASFVAVRDAITRNLLEELLPAMHLPANGTAPSDPEAYRLYLIGKTRLGERSCEGEAALSLLEESLVLLSLSLAASAAAAIRRDPNGVNVSAQGPTTVFITFGGLQNQVPVEAFWCGALVQATPDIGMRCDPGTIFGRLPIRYDQSRLSGGVFTDIMSIPATVSRRAYQDAAAGRTSSFFYVRRFASSAGGPDEYVFVTCRLAGTGARVPLALLDVQMRFATEDTVLPVESGSPAPPFHAEIAYNGTGRLRGRWEIVLPGDEPPAAYDLLTEGTLPPAERGLQRRFTQLGRFNVFLPPTGKVRLDGPDPSRLPTTIEGMYMILLRIEASDDKEADSNLAAAGAGAGVVHSGAAAGFPMPVLRYYVGALDGAIGAESGAEMRALLPVPSASVRRGDALEFTWSEGAAAPYTRIEVRDAGRTVVAAAVVAAGIGRYRLPPVLAERVAAGEVEWRVAGIGADGREVASTPWRKLVVAAP